MIINKRKKIIILLTGLIVIGLFGYFIYRVVLFPQFKQPPQQKFQPNETITKKIQLEIKEKIVSPALSSDGKALYYFTQGNKPGIYKYNLLNRQSELFFSVSDIGNISWSPDRKSAIFMVVQYPERFKIIKSPFYLPDAIELEQTYWFFNLENQKLLKLNRFVDTYIWTANNRIIFRSFNYEADPAEDMFYEFDPATMQSVRIAKNPEGGNIEFIYADDKDIFYLPIYSESAQSQIMRLDRQNSQAQPFVSDNLSDALASPLGNQFLATAYNGQNNSSSLMIVDKNTKSLKQFDFPSTLINMVAWSQDEKSLFVSDPNERGGDQFYQIDVDSQKITEIKYQAPESEFNQSQNLFLSLNNTALFFLSSGQLFRMDLN